MYTLTDAVRLKDHLLDRWEAADRDPSIVSDGALNVVVVGGGPTGVETAGAIAELYRGDLAKDYGGVNEEDARVTLVEAGPELFPMFKPKLREYTAKALTDRTVEVRTGALVASVSPTQVTLKSGDVATRAHAGLGRRAPGQRARPFARARAAARKPHRRRRRAHASRPSRGLRRRGRGGDHGREDGHRAAPARLGRPPVR